MTTTTSHAETNLSRRAISYEPITQQTYNQLPTISDAEDAQKCSFPYVHMRCMILAPRRVTYIMKQEDSNGGLQDSLVPTPAHSMQKRNGAFI